MSLSLPPHIPSGPSSGGVLSHLASHCCMVGGRSASAHSRDGWPVWLEQRTARCCCPRPHCAEHCEVSRYHGKATTQLPLSPSPPPLPHPGRAHLPHPTHPPPSGRGDSGASCSAWWLAAWQRVGSAWEAAWRGGRRSCKELRGGGGLARSWGCTAVGGGVLCLAGTPILACTGNREDAGPMGGKEGPANLRPVQGGPLGLLEGACDWGRLPQWAKSILALPGAAQGVGWAQAGRGG